MSRKKNVAIVLGLLAALGICIGIYFFYWSYHPHIYLSAPMDSTAEADRHIEWVMVAMAEHRGIPTAACVEEELTRLADWNDQIITELYAYATPCDIRVSGENDGGHITLCYEGYVTTKDGERLDYFRENTFDLFVRDKDFRVKAREMADEG